MTSKRLADITKARGFYQAKDRKGDGKGKSKGKKGDSFSKGKGKGKKGGKSSVISKGNGMSGSASSGKSGGGKGKGKPGILPNRANLEVQQKRLEEASCLGCGSPNHWLRDCPKHNNYTAQITSAGVTLDAEGGAVASSWMTSFCEQKQECFELPELICEEVSGSPGETSLMTSQKGVTSLSTTTHEQDDWNIPRNPRVLLQHVHPDTTIMIADTGCQRQVAGKLWHEGRQKAISPLQPGQCGERCSFSFGPNAGVPSRIRFVYPAGLGGVAVALGVSVVKENAPALFSRPSFTTLGAIPNLITGVMHFVALKTTSKLCLSPCGHLAIRIDEWPDEVFPWSPQHDEHGTAPDAWCSTAAMLETARLVESSDPPRRPPHAILGGSPSTKMAASLAQADASNLGVRPHGDAISADVCINEPTSQASRCGVDQLLSSPDCNNNAEHHGSLDTCSAEPSRHLSRRSHNVHSSQRIEGIWCRRKESQDLRSVRIPMGGTGGQQKQGNHLAEGTTQSQPYVQNSAESCSRVEQGNTKESSVFGPHSILGRMHH